VSEVGDSRPKRLTVAERALVRAMYGGRCAYCGCELPERWHVDHLKPVRRRRFASPGRSSMRLPQRHRLDNCMPSCPPCNIDKHARSLEQWRAWLGAHLRSLQRQPNYRLVRAHGLVAEVEAPVVFFFERVEAARPAPAPRGRRASKKSDEGVPPGTLLAS
jgi:hypothetical protein